jgi:lactate racemase
MEKFDSVSLPFGKRSYRLKINKNYDILRRKKTKELVDPKEELMKQFISPINSKPLKDLLKGKKDIIIVVSDKTRPIPYKDLFDILLPFLLKQGFSKKDISFIIANGSHAIDFEKDSVEILGREIKESYKVYYNNCYQSEDFEFIGYEENGARIKVNKNFLKADFRILTGLINPHIYAGFSGGRKSVAPGLCDSGSWKLIHGVELMDDPNTRLGNIANNHLDKIGTAVSKKVGVDFIINVTLNSEQKINGIFCGELEEAFKTGVQFIKDSYKIKTDKKYDIAITHGGGYPLDGNFYQMIKGMSVPVPYIKDDGEIICLASGEGGMGTGLFLDLAREIDDLGQWREGLEDREYRMEQWTFQAYYNLFKNNKIKLYSPLFRKEPKLKNMVEEIKDIEKYLDKKISKDPDINIGVFMNGPYCL